MVAEFEHQIWFPRVVIHGVPCTSHVWLLISEASYRFNSLQVLGKIIGLRDTMFSALFCLLVDQCWRMALNTVLLGRTRAAPSPVLCQKDPDSDGSYFVRFYMDVAGDCLFVRITRGAG